MTIRARRTLKQLIADLDRARNRLRKSHDEVVAIGKAIAEVCTHPEDRREDYNWHHGYGKYVTGEMCTLCESRRSCKSSKNWISAEEYADLPSRWDD